MFNLIQTQNINSSDAQVNSDDLEILFFVYNRVRVQQDKNTTVYSVARNLNLCSPVLVSIKLTRLTLDGYLTKTVDTKDVRFVYVNITTRGIEILKRYKVI